MSRVDAYIAILKQRVLDTKAYSQEDVQAMDIDQVEKVLHELGMQTYISECEYEAYLADSK